MNCDDDQIVACLSQEDNEPQELGYHEIGSLQEMGIAANEINRLKDAGVHTVTRVLQMPSKRLMAIKGLSEAKVEKIKAAAYKVSPSRITLASLELQRRLSDVFFISTGSKELDKVLGGGVESQNTVFSDSLHAEGLQSMLEMHGEYRTGKTQICHTLAITAQMPGATFYADSCYRGGRVVYIDTEGTFRPERLEPICERFHLDYNEAVDNIFYVRALNSEHQTHILSELSGLLCDQKGVIKLIILDSVMALFRVDFSGRGELADRQQRLGQYLHALHELACEYNVAVVMSNQMTSDPGATMSFVSDPKKAIGGHVLGHAVQARLSLKKGSGDQRIAKLIDSPNMPESDATFTIRNGGVCDGD